MKSSPLLYCTGAVDGAEPILLFHGRKPTLWLRAELYKYWTQTWTSHSLSLVFSLQLLSNCSVNTSQKQAGVQEPSISQRNICFGNVWFSQLFRFHFCNHIVRIWIQTRMLSSLVDFFIGLVDVWAKIFCSVLNLDVFANFFVCTNDFYLHITL